VPGARRGQVERQLELLDARDPPSVTGDEIRVEIDETINVYEQETP
jgi:hypothetical protein